MRYFRFSLTMLCFMMVKLVIAQNVGINLSNPIYTLDVNGDVNFRSGVRINGSRGDSGAVMISKGPSLDPVWSKWQGFRAGASSNQNLAVVANLSTYTQLTYDNFGGLRFRIGSGYNNATSSYTVPESGVYLIMASATMNNINAGFYRIAIRQANSSGVLAVSTAELPSALSLYDISTYTISYLMAGATYGAYLSSSVQQSISVTNGASTFFSFVKL